TEVGPIAAECPAGAMHVLATNVWVEIFRDGAPVAPGTTGEGVATTLVNRGMPLVRCRIGDTASISPAPCRACLPQPVLTELRAGSAGVLLAADGRAVHGSVLGEPLERYLGLPPLGRVQQILFEQLDQRRWRVHVEWPRADDFARLAEQLLELLR